MRFFSLFLSMLLLSSVLFAGADTKKRYLVTSKAEVIPLSPEESAASVIKKRTERSTSGSVVCPDRFTFGYPPDIYTVNSNFGAYHRDVLGEWFVAQATGTIDTIYWFNRAAIGAHDSTLYVRVHNSNIGPTYGPGIRPGPFNPPCQNWGYWVNTNDCDQGVAAFIEESTNPAWVSTINGSPVPSGPPFGSELWGFGGFPKQVHPNTTEGIAMADLSTLTVTVGDKFFISMRVADNGGLLCGHKEQGTEEDRTEWNASGFTVGTNDPDYPARNWKFYEHDKGPSNCAGFPIDSIQRGWVARGGFGTDTLTVAVYNFWYVQSVTSNVPPIITNVTPINTTFDPSAKTVSADIEDCNPANPGGAGVATAVIQYNKNDVAQTPVAMTNIGGDTWEGVIPAQAVGDVINYKIIATDADAAVGQSVAQEFSIVQLGNEWYSVDTAVVCVKQDIKGTGTQIAPASFFNPNYTGSGTFPKDDGTAGPYDMGGNFVVFGDTFRFAWVGVNGAIGLTKAADDTNDVNANGFATTAWDLPQPVVHHGRADSVDTGGMPRMFISPFWADHIVEDSTATFGSIWYGNNGDPCQFIVQWDSIGTFDANGSTQDETKFRVILNRCDGTVEFQYNSPGLNGLDSAALVGMQYDTSSAAKPNPYIFLNQLTYPYETKPRANWCLKMSPTIGSSVLDGWNIVSVAGTPNDANYAKTHLFPQATSSAFAYNAGYVAQATLANGPGYWMKFSGNQHAGGVPSTWAASNVASVVNGWNIVGSTSGFVPVSTGIVAGGGTAVTSPYYGYSGGYSVATTIAPGQGYWVKVALAGTLTMTASAAAPKAQPTAAELGIDGMNTITIRDSHGKVQTLYVGEENQLKQDISYFELPPVPPVGAFDARFSASGRMVETYPNTIDRAIEYPVSIQSAAYPVTVSWKLNGVENKRFALTAGGKSTDMSGTGTRVISDSKVNTLIVTLSEGNTPKEFALSHNYPNPFNPVTRFRVDVATTSQVEVAVYDILGRKITTLLSAERAAGSYTMEWNGMDNQGLTVPTGMYFIRMTAGDFTDNQKVMLMK